MEELGGGQDIGLEDGSGLGDPVGGGEETEEETFVGLPALKSQEPQLLGLQIFLLRIPSPAQSFW